MKKCYLFLIYLINITALPALSQTGGNNPNSAALSDSSQFYVQEIVSSKIPILADFWAEWCGPCKIIAPSIDQIKNEYKGKIRILKINIDRNRSLASHFHIVSIPVIFIIKDKVVFRSFLGVQPKAVYISAINEVLVQDFDSSDSKE